MERQKINTKDSYVDKLTITHTEKLGGAEFTYSATIEGSRSCKLATDVFVKFAEAFLLYTLPDEDETTE